LLRRVWCAAAILQKRLKVALLAIRPYPGVLGRHAQALRVPGEAAREAAMMGFDSTRTRTMAAACAGLAVSLSLHAQSAPDGQTPRKNWYNDPFFALSKAVSACPLPLGPLMTKAEAEDDAHYRVERGTTCWLAHKCTKPNSYMYDDDIAAAVRQQLEGNAMLADTSLWITVQRRFVYAEGCVPAAFDRDALRRRLEAIPDVEQVFVRVTSDPRGPLPYKTLAHPD
jgi:hypothetical protein